MRTFGQIKKLIILTLVAASLVLVAIECVNCAYIIGEKVQVKKELNDGRKELEEADYESALEIFKSAIKQDPYNVEAYWGAASAYAGLSDFDKAIETLEGAEKMFCALGESKDSSSSRKEIRLRIEQIKIMSSNS